MIKNNNSLLEHAERSTGIDRKFLSEMDMNHINFFVNNKDKIRVEKADNIESMVYVLTKRGIIYDYNKKSRKNFLDKLKDFFKGEAVIDHTKMDEFCHRVFENKNLLKKYLPSVFNLSKNRYWDIYADSC